MPSVQYTQKINIELIKLLYRQISLALWAETFAALCMAWVLWSEIPQQQIVAWLLFNLCICGLGRHLLVIAYSKNNGNDADYEKMRTWLYFFTLGAFLSGVSWGIVGSILMVEKDVLRQTFTIILLIGITAAANPLYSPIKFVYLIFLIPAFFPLAIWLMLQGGIFFLLGMLALVYILIMLATSLHTHKLISNSLLLGFQNVDLIEGLVQAKETLELRTQELEKSLSLFRATLEATTDGILVISSQKKIEHYNRKFIDMFQIAEANLRHKPTNDLFVRILPQLENPTVFNESLISGTEESYDELHFKDGRVFERYSYPQRIGETAVGRVWCFRDVTGRKSLEAKLFQQANFDILTGLPNRALLLDRLEQAIRYAKMFQTNLYILFIDIDRFKLINDTLGHPLGDKLLVEVAHRLRAVVNENDIVCREGGDEFVIVLNGVEDETVTITMTNTLLDVIRDVYMIEGRRINISVSVGISCYPKDGIETEILIRKADIAMYHAKELGRNNFQFFTEEMNKKVLRRMVIENHLRDALIQKELTLEYQPIVSLANGKIVGLEALLRWRHPKFVPIPTAELITVAEESGLIIPIGDWVLENACKHIQLLHQQGFKDLKITINLSAQQFKREEFIEHITQLISRLKFDTNFLAIELTESILMDDVAKAIVSLNKLKEMGITILIDDFGTGYSSLSYLKQLPVNKLKIDRSFIEDIPRNLDDAAITAAILALAGQLNLTVVAEGVENKQQLEFLIKHGCDEVQGFFFSQPIAADKCLPLLKENNIKPFKLEINDIEP